MMVAHSV